MYRDELHDDPCFVCQEPAVAGCACCLRRACAKHAASSIRGWCVKCDDAFYMFRKQEASTMGLMVWVFGIPAWGIAGLTYPALLVVAVVWGVLGLPVLGLVKRSRQRRKFFAIMRTRGELPPKRERDEDLLHAQAEYHRRRDQRIDEAIEDKADGESGS